MGHKNKRGNKGKETMINAQVQGVFAITVSLVMVVTHFTVLSCYYTSPNLATILVVAFWCSLVAGAALGAIITRSKHSAIPRLESITTEDAITWQFVGDALIQEQWANLHEYGSDPLAYDARRDDIVDIQNKWKDVQTFLRGTS